MSIHWVIVVAVIVVFAQSLVYRRWGIRHVSYERYFAVREAFVGDQVEMVEVIANHKWLPLPWLRLESMIDAGLQFAEQDDMAISSGDRFQNHHSLFSMPSHTRIVRKHTITCKRRGAYVLRTATLTCGDIFNLHGDAVQLELDATLLVYPQLIDVRELPLPAHSWLGDHVVRRWIMSDPFVVSGVRGYQSGDPMGRINWKATARTGELQVHNEDFTADHRLMVVLNFEVSEDMWHAVTKPDMIEHGISIAASLVQLTVQQGIEAGFACNAHTNETEKQNTPLIIAPSLGRTQLTFVLEQMARLNVAITTDFSTFLEQHIVGRMTEQTDFLFITAFVNDKIQSHIDQLRREGHAVEILQLAEQKELATA